jgi:lipopolysaccharide transport system ATP-binding protein
VERYRSFRDMISNAATAPIRRLRSRVAGVNRKGATTIWALKDVSCEIKRGAVVGVIGPNGAGKSTLLKILSRIVDPTEGYADLHGRVGSLLEVGTGFHTELTGRENVFLNGSILGIKRAQIQQKFDEIVDFAGVGKFIDTQVKYYSTGMYLRLAFAVAAHLETEILLVDEVLAVGDVNFQQKCLGKMSEISAQGRTVLFVSHNLGAITELCDSSIVLDQGRVTFAGNVVDGVGHYTRTVFHSEQALGSGTRWRSLRISSDSFDAVVTPIVGPEPFRVEAVMQFDEAFQSARFSCVIRDASGNVVVNDRMDTEGVELGRLTPGSYRLRLDFPSLWLSPGVYTLCFKFVGRKESGAEAKYVSERIIFEAVNGWSSSHKCLLAPRIEWDMSREKSGIPMIATEEPMYEEVGV